MEWPAVLQQALLDLLDRRADWSSWFPNQTQLHSLLHLCLQLGGVTGQLSARQALSVTLGRNSDDPEICIWLSSLSGFSHGSESRYFRYNCGRLSILGTLSLRLAVSSLYQQSFEQVFPSFWFLLQVLRCCQLSTIKIKYETWTNVYVPAKRESRVCSPDFALCTIPWELKVTLLKMIFPTSTHVYTHPAILCPF